MTFSSIADARRDYGGDAAAYAAFLTAIREMLAREYDTAGEADAYARTPAWQAWAYGICALACCRAYPAWGRAWRDALAATHALPLPRF